MSDGSALVGAPSLALLVALAVLSAVVVHYGMRWLRWRWVRLVEWAGALFAVLLVGLLGVSVPVVGPYFDGFELFGVVFVPSVYVGSLDLTRWWLFVMEPLRETTPVFLACLVALAVLLRRSEGHGLPRTVCLAAAEVMLLAVVFSALGLRLLAGSPVVWPSWVALAILVGVTVTLAYLPPLRHLLARQGRGRVDVRATQVS